MAFILQKLLRAGASIETMINWIWAALGRLFLSKAELARRTTGRFQQLQRREQEAERLDRLRHPRDYQGR